MPQGLQIFDENGEEVFNSNTRTFKVLERFNLVPNTTRVITHPLVAEQEVIYFVTPPVMGGYDFITTSRSGTTYTLNIHKDVIRLFQQGVTFNITVGTY